MKNSKLREISVFFATLLCGIVLVQIYQQYFGNKIEGASLHAIDPAKSAKVIQKNSSGAIESKKNTEQKESNNDLTESIQTRTFSNSTAADVLSRENQSPTPKARLNPSDPASEMIPDRQNEMSRLRLAINMHMQDRDADRWTNPGLNLWRSCSKFLSENNNNEIPYELISACRELLSDAIFVLRESVTAESAQEVIEVTKEIRSDRWIASQAEKSELDKISERARKLRLPRPPQGGFTRARDQAVFSTTPKNSTPTPAHQIK